MAVGIGERTRVESLQKSAAIPGRASGLSSSRGRDGLLERRSGRARARIQNGLQVEAPAPRARCTGYPIMSCVRSGVQFFTPLW